jgi:hypothetical protein
MRMETFITKALGLRAHRVVKIEPEIIGVVSTGRDLRRGQKISTARPTTMSP